MGVVLSLDRLQNIIDDDINMIGSRLSLSYTLPVLFLFMYLFLSPQNGVKKKIPTNIVCYKNLKYYIISYQGQFP